MRELVATTRVAHTGGPCRHCHRFMTHGMRMHKLTWCCEVHGPTSRGRRNGKGVWVCTGCVLALVEKGNKNE